MNMNVFVICVGNPDDAPSTKYRIKQYQPFLNKKGVNIQYIDKSNLTYRKILELKKYDVVINQKSPLGLLKAILIKLNSKRLIFDFDDCMWSRPRRPYHPLSRWRLLFRFKFWLNLADEITTSSQHLANYFPKFNSKINILPMALNLEEWMPIQNAIRKNKLVIGWAGAPVNFTYLKDIDKPLIKFLSENPDWELRIFSGKKPEINAPFIYHPYEEGKEIEFIKMLDIGLLPLSEDEHASCKSPIKAIQYIACGIPVIGNVFGATREILNEKNSLQADTSTTWYNQLQFLSTSEEIRSELSKNGREQALSKFNIIETENKLFYILNNNLEN